MSSVEHHENMIVNSSGPTAGGNVSRPSAGTALYCAPRAAALAALGLASAVRSTEPLKGLGPSGDDADAFCRAPRLRAAAMMSGAFPAARASPGPCVFDGPAGPRSRRAPREQPGTGRRLAPPPQSPTCPRVPAAAPAGAVPVSLTRIPTAAALRAGSAVPTRRCLPQP